MAKYRYHPMAMHLHTIYQPGSSMSGHMYNASKLGMEYIRFTDHDVHTGPKKLPFHSFDFSRGVLKYSDSADPNDTANQCGWNPVGDPEISFNGGSMILSASGNSKEAVGVSFTASGKRHNTALVADVTVTVGISCEFKGDARVILDIQLSEHPPEHTYSHLRYVIGKVKEPHIPHVAEIPLEISHDNLYTLRLSEDVQRDGISQIVGGLDNAFSTLSILIEPNGGSAVCNINRFELHWVYKFDDVIARQRVIADEVGKKYGIKPFVTTEISGAGQHKNCFSTKVPVIDYSEWNYDITQMEAIAHVKAHGGIFAYNHPFEKYKRQDLTDEEKESILLKKAMSFIASKVYGASMMEVMFVDGRGKFGLQQFLQLWDMISMGGVFITGYGDSDSHHSDRGWFSGQNAASWIAADENIPFPIPEDIFIESMKAGRVYAGDPIFLRDPISFTCGNTPMGGIIPIADRDYSSRTLKFTVLNPGEDWSVRIIIDGSVFHEQKIGKTDTFTFTFEVQPNMTVSFARAELYNGSGRCIMLTNPIYLVRTAEYSGELPKERLY